MTFWQFLDRRWPGERAWVTVLLASLIAALLKMAERDPTLWRVELFKTLLTAAVITGALNMVLAFHFAANKDDETKAQNTGKLADAFRSVAESGGSGPSTDEARAEGAELVKNAAVDEAEQVSRGQPVPGVYSEEQGR